jgi:uncharacterized protein (DUF1697 family)
MAKLIAFLRAINVGKGRVVKMDLLRGLFVSLGFSGVETFIASGNVAFDSRIRNEKRLAQKIEKKLRAILGYDVAVFIRTAAELDRIASFEPFPKTRGESDAGVNVLFLSDMINEESKHAVMALRTETDEFQVRGREIYWLRRRKPGGRDFTTVPIEKAVRKPFTVRGANTVKKLAAKYSPAARPK